MHPMKVGNINRPHPGFWLSLPAIQHPANRKSEGLTKDWLNWDTKWDTKWDTQNQFETSTTWPRVVLCHSSFRKISLSLQHITNTCLSLSPSEYRTRVQRACDAWLPMVAPVSWLADTSSCSNTRATHVSTSHGMVPGTSSCLHRWVCEAPLRVLSVHSSWPLLTIVNQH